MNELRKEIVLALINGGYSFDVGVLEPLVLELEALIAAGETQQLKRVCEAWPGVYYQVTGPTS